MMRYFRILIFLNWIISKLTILISSYCFENCILLLTEEQQVQPYMKAREAY